MLARDNAIARSGTFALCQRTVHQMGYGAMQFGARRDNEGA